MFTVYVLKSLESDHFYTGMTQNLERRISDHNKGFTKSIKAFAPFAVVYTESFESSEMARKREKYLKTCAGRKFLVNLNIRPCTWKKRSK
jgi:putative endonuclease